MNVITFFNYRFFFKIGSFDAGFLEYFRYVWDTRFKSGEPTLKGILIETHTNQLIKMTHYFAIKKGKFCEINECVNVCISSIVILLISVISVISSLCVNIFIVEEF